jgi:hypothetical protein
VNPTLTECSNTSFPNNTAWIALTKEQQGKYNRMSCLVQPWPHPTQENSKKKKKKKKSQHIPESKTLNPIRYLTSEFRTIQHTSIWTKDVEGALGFDKALPKNLSRTETELSWSEELVTIPIDPPSLFSWLRKASHTWVKFGPPLALCSSFPTVVQLFGASVAPFFICKHKPHNIPITRGSIMYQSVSKGYRGVELCPVFTQGF